MFHSVFHPSEAASSAEGANTASRADRLARDDASAAADDWPFEEESGASPENFAQPLEAQHCEMQCSAWEPIGLFQPEYLAP